MRFISPSLAQGPPCSDNDLSDFSKLPCEEVQSMKRQGRSKERKRSKKSETRNKEYTKGRKACESSDRRAYQPSGLALGKAIKAELIHTRFEAKDLSAAQAAWIGKRLKVEAVQSEIQRVEDTRSRPGTGCK